MNSEIDLSTVCIKFLPNNNLILLFAISKFEELVPWNYALCFFVQLKLY